MASIFTLVGLVVVAGLAGILLRESRREGWYAIVFALVVGGTFELVIGASWYPKGFPLLQLFGFEDPSGWG